MSTATSIEWTRSDDGTPGATWNPIAGCSIVSPGCKRCYAMRMAARIERMQAALGKPTHYAGLTEPSKAGAVWNGKVAVAPDAILTQPLRWKRPRRIFVNSMSDLFHERVADETIDRVVAVMALTPHHTYQVLTKRADRMRQYFGALKCGEGYRPYVRRPGWTARDPRDGDRVLLLKEGQTWPLPNVWLGVSAEDQRRAEERIPHLLATPAAVRWISAEPLIGPLRLDGWLRSKPHDVTLDWVVAGGESGPGARPSHPDWFRVLRNQCSANGVPYFFKQWGAWAPDGVNFVARDTQAELGTVTMLASPGYAVAWRCRSEPKGTITEGDQLKNVGKGAAGNVLDGRTHQEWPR